MTSLDINHPVIHHIISIYVSTIGKYPRSIHDLHNIINGRTYLLHEAIKLHSLNTVEWMLNNGFKYQLYRRKISIHNKIFNKKTYTVSNRVYPIHIAIKSNNIPMIKLLLKYGATFKCVYEDVLYGNYSRHEHNSYDTIKSAERIINDLRDGSYYWGNNLYWVMKQHEEKTNNL